MTLRVKICGITQPDQGQEIARLGAHSIGFICVQKSPRYVTPEQIRAIVEQLPPQVVRVGVFMDAPFEEIVRTVQASDLTSIQLHGAESPELCDRLRQTFPEIELIKAFRIRSGEDLRQTQPYEDHVDWLLLDAYHPNLGGGTGQTLDWRSLQTFHPQRPWLLAGGLTPDNVQDALSLIHPNGIDLSSGVETSPGHKDLQRVEQLFQRLNDCVV